MLQRFLLATTIIVGLLAWAAPAAPRAAAARSGAVAPALLGTPGATGIAAKLAAAGGLGSGHPVLWPHWRRIGTGGIEPLNRAAIIARYRARTGSVGIWDHLASSLPTPRSGAQVLTDPQGEIWVIGGVTGDGQPSDLVEEYAVAGQDKMGNPQYQWWCSKGDTASGCAKTPLLPLPTARASMAGAVLPIQYADGTSDALLFLVGGFDQSGQAVSTVEAYSVALGQWFCSSDDAASGCADRFFPPLPTPRADAGAVVARAPGNAQASAGSLVYVMGGVTNSSVNNGVSNVVEAYDPAANAWSCSTGDAATSCPQTLPPLPDDLWGMGAVAAANGQIYVLGGNNAQGAPTSATYVFDPAAYDPTSTTNPWLLGTAMPTPRAGFAVVQAQDGQIYAIGGAQGTTALTTVEALDPATGSWSCSTGDTAPSCQQTLPPLPTPLLFPGAASAYGQVYVLAGQAASGAGQASGSVYTYTPMPATPPPFPNVLQQSYPSTILPPEQLALTEHARYDGVSGNAIFGNYTYQHTDLQMPGRGPRVAITRSYNSLYPVDGILGWGWNVTFGMHLTFGGPSSPGCPDATKVCVTRDDGRVDPYPYQNGTVSTPAGWADTLVHNGDGTFTLTTREHLVYSFSAAGSLLSEQDADGNTVTLSYTNGRWTGITDASGRAWTLTYNGAGKVASVTDPAGQTVQYTYDAHDELIGVKDAAGGVTTFTYDDGSYPDTDDQHGGGHHQILNIIDANGNLVVANYYNSNTDAQGNWYGNLYAQETDQDQDPSHAEWRYFFYFNLNAQGQDLQITAAIDPVGAVSYTIYKAGAGFNNPLYRIDPMGRVTQYTYQSNGLLQTETDPNGGVTSYTYDDATPCTNGNSSNGNICSITDPLGNVTTMTYDANNNLLSRTDALGHTTSYTYNSGNHPLTMTDAICNANAACKPAPLTYCQNHPADCHTTRYAYDAHGQETSVTDPLGNQTTYGYDSLDNYRTSVTDARGFTTTYAYDSAGRVIQQTDPLGHSTATQYNALNLPVRVTAADGGVTTYTYDAVGNRLTTTDPLGHVTRNVYDGMYNLVQTIDPLGYATVYAYDRDNRQISRTLPTGAVSTQTYDLAGEKVSATSALCNADASCQQDPITYCTNHRSDCHTTQYAYDADGNLLLTLDPSGAFHFYVYDKDNRLTTVAESTLNATQFLRSTNPASALQVTQYGYDAAGNRTSVTDARGNKTTYAYDPDNRLVQVTDPLGRTSSTGYDADGRVTGKTNGAGQSIANTYDQDGNLLTTAAGGVTTTYTYDQAGNRASMQDTQASKTTYAYDPMNRVTAINSPRGTVSYTYDRDGNRLSMAQPGRTTTYCYDADNRLASVQSGAGACGSNLIVSYGYDSAGHNTLQTFGNGVQTALSYDIEGRLRTMTTSNAGGATLEQIRYVLDTMGNRTAEIATGLLATYTYDALNRLTWASYAFTPPGGAAQYHTYSYGYDAAGNRTSATVDGATTAYGYDAANQLVSAGGATITYDGAGRITNDGQHTYSYDAYDRLQAIGGGISATYRYDGDGNRIGETVNGAGSTFLLDTAAPLPQRIAITDGGGNTSAYVYGLQRALDVAPNGSARYEHADGLGSVRLLTDGGGNAASRDWYTPTGALLSGSGPFGFTGEPYTASNSLVSLRARDYSPTLDRFLTMDPHAPSPTAPLTYNPYPYAGDNPVNVTDHSGLLCYTDGVFDPTCGSGGLGGFGGDSGFGFGGPAGVVSGIIAQTAAQEPHSAPLGPFGNGSDFGLGSGLSSGGLGGDSGTFNSFNVMGPFGASASSDASNAAQTALNIGSAFGDPGGAAGAAQLLNNSGGLSAVDMPDMNSLVMQATGGLPMSLFLGSGAGGDPLALLVMGGGLPALLNTPYFSGGSANPLIDIEAAQYYSNLSQDTNNPCGLFSTFMSC